jgi:hypothetical protein
MLHRVNVMKVMTMPRTVKDPLTGLELGISGPVALMA